MEIKPYEKNAKEHTERQLKKIAASIDRLGFDQAIVVDKDGVIIIGHARYLAATKYLHWTDIRYGEAMAKKGEKFIPILIRDDLTDEEIKTRRLNDNQLNALTGVDMELVKGELRLLSLEMIDLTGFDANLILETTEDTPDLSKIGTPKSVLGDLYELGRHKLLCGDSTLPETYSKLLGEEKARLAYCDPPYSVDYHSTKGTSKTKKSYSYESNKFGGTGGRIFNDDKTPAEALIFYKDALKQIYDFTADDVTLYWWFASSLTELNMQAWRETGWHFSQQVIWLKEHFVFAMGQLFHRIYEPAMVGWKEGKHHYVNGTFASFNELWLLDKKTFADHLDGWHQRRDNISKYIHPTQKPVQLAERALKRSSEKNDIVLDAFGGSGSTLIACEQLERSARLIELDPKYCDAIVTRWTQYSQNTHVIKNGEKILW